MVIFGMKTSTATVQDPAIETTERAYLTAVGRRKRAVARVRLLKNGTGAITVNGRTLQQYFTTPASRTIGQSGMEAVGQSDKVDVVALVAGGGARAQAEALRLGISRALCELNPTFRRALKKVGYLTRDARIKERKKPGLKKARRAPQWAKR